MKTSRPALNSASKALPNGFIPLINTESISPANTKKLISTSSQGEKAHFFFFFYVLLSGPINTEILTRPRSKARARAWGCEHRGGPMEPGCHRGGGTQRAHVALWFLGFGKTFLPLVSCYKKTEVLLAVQLLFLTRFLLHSQNYSKRQFLQ